MVVSARRSPWSPPLNLSAGIIRPLAGRLETETISHPWPASQAKPLQLIPPTLPGIARVPASLGGENIEVPLIAASSAAQAFRSPSEIAQTLAAVRVCGTSGGTVVGNGWVGDLTSP